MLLFEHKQNLQSYNTQSSKQREILYFILQKSLFKDYVQQTASRDYNELFQGLVTSLNLKYT